MYLRTLIRIHNDKYSSPDRKFNVVWDPDNAPKFPENEIKEKLRTMKDFLKPSEQRNDTDSPYESTQFKSTMYYLQELQSRCKGHFIFSIREDQSQYKYDIAYVKELPDGTQDIWFGYNLLNYTDSYDSSNLCTAVLPIASIGSYGTSKVGNTVATMPDERFVFGDTSVFSLFVQGDDVYTEAGGIRTYTAIHVDDGQTVFILNNNAHDMYRVRYVDDSVVVDNEPFTTRIVPSWSTVLGYDETSPTKEAEPVYLTRDHEFNSDLVDHKVWVFRCLQFFPTTGAANTYYMSSDESVTISDYTVRRTKFWNGSAYQDTGYYDNIQDREHNIANNVTDTFPYHVLKYIPSEEDEQLYISARMIPGYKTGYETKFIYAVWYNQGGNGYLLEQKEAVVPNGGHGSWNTVIDECIDISNTSDGAECYGANGIFISAWGKTVEITVKQQEYSYKSPDYTLGDPIEPYEILDGYTMVRNDDTGAISIDSGWAGHFVYKYDLTSIDSKKVYLSVRSYDAYSNVPDESTCLYCVRLVNELGSDIYYELPAEEGMTTYINKVLDLESPELKAGAVLEVAGFGLIFDNPFYDSEDPSSDPKASIILREYVEQSGSMTDYMTVEGVDDYFYKSYEQHVDEKVHSKGSPYVESQTLNDIYGRIERTVEFKNVGTPDLLVERAADYLFNAQYDDLEFTLNGVDMHELNLDIEAFDVSTNVRIVSDFHNIDRRLPLTSLKINLQNDLDNDISLSKSDTLGERLTENWEGSDLNAGL